MMTPERANELAAQLLGQGHSTRVTANPDARGDLAALEIMRRPGLTWTAYTYEGLAQWAANQQVDLQPADADGGAHLRVVPARNATVRP